MDFNLSFEFFPPHTEKGLTSLQATTKTIVAESPSLPDYFSVTFGAAGSSTQDKTLTTCLALQDSVTTPLCPHLSCVGTTKAKLTILLNKYKSLGITALLALRGDLPLGVKSLGDFQHANELVTWIKKEYGDTFHISVACYPEIHPQSPNAKVDFDHFKRKVDSGADAAITQYFFNLDSYQYFKDLCAQANITIPIIPGIMPITQYEQLSRFSATCGAEIPRWLRKQLEVISGDRSAVEKFGTEILTQLCQGLKNNDAPGLHFYTLNKAGPCLAICKELGLEAKQKSKVRM